VNRQAEMIGGGREIGTALAKLLAFLRRDFREALTYKLAFAYSLVGIFLSTATFFFVAKLVPRGSPALSPYGGDYFSFAVVGVAFSSLLGIFQEGLPAVIRNAQVSGTLEALLVTQTSVPTVLLGSSLYSLVFQSLRTVLHLALAVAVFGMALGRVNWPGVAAVSVLTAVCFLSLGILSASFILVYKLGNPLSWVFSSLSGLLGGMVFPVALLPSWIRWASYLLPVTYSLNGMRRSLLASVPFSRILPDIAALAVFNAVLFPLSLAAFRAAIRKAKKDGTLTHY
jgi:ABC-2 type transport system permease protein